MTTMMDWYILLLSLKCSKGHLIHVRVLSDSPIKFSHAPFSKKGEVDVELRITFTM